MIAVAAVILAVLWVASVGRQRKRDLIRARKMTAEAVADIRVLTITFSEGPIEQRFFIQSEAAQREFETIHPGDYAGDGRHVVNVHLFQPFTPRGQD